MDKAQVRSRGAVKDVSKFSRPKIGSVKNKNSVNVAKATGGYCRTLDFCWFWGEEFLVFVIVNVSSFLGTCSKMFTYVHLLCLNLHQKRQHFTSILKFPDFLEQQLPPHRFKRWNSVRFDGSPDPATPQGPKTRWRNPRLGWKHGNVWSTFLDLLYAKKRDRKGSRHIKTCNFVKKNHNYFYSFVKKQCSWMIHKPFHPSLRIFYDLNDSSSCKKRCYRLQHGTAVRNKYDGNNLDDGSTEEHLRL